jgi:pyridine nucleotide-disulfide oxidoreductase family protein
MVLRAFDAHPPPRARITLVSPFATLVYSGMVPGLIAGHYVDADCRIALAPLAARAGATRLEGRATAIDAAARSVTVMRTDGSCESLPFDLLSIDVGGTIEPDALPGAAGHGIFVRPIEPFISVLTARLATPRLGGRDVVVIGGGAGGAELAMAVRHRLGAAARVSLVSGGPPLLATQSAALRRRALRALRLREIALIEDSVAEIFADHVVLGSGARQACDTPVVAIGVSAPSWLRGSGLALDAAGFVATGATLQSLSHPYVLAAGDVAARADAPRPRSGVYAVRAGPPLAANLRRALAGVAMAAYDPQRRSLNLVSCGDRRAIAAWGDRAFEGRLMWWWKDFIDRRFVAAGRPGPMVGIEN